MDCEHYELMTCKIHGELKEEAFKNECEDFKEKEDILLNTTNRIKNNQK